MQAVEAALAKLETLGQERGLSAEFLDPLRARHGQRLRHITARNDGDESHRKLLEIHDAIEYALIEEERRQINELYRAGDLQDEVRRRIERELDLRESQLTSIRGGAAD